MLGGPSCAARSVVIASALAVRPPGYRLTVGARTIAQIRVAGSRADSEIVIHDFPALLGATLGAGAAVGEPAVELTVLAIDFDALDAGEQQIDSTRFAARGWHTHGGAGPPAPLRQPRPRFARIRFEATLFDRGVPVGRVVGAISGREPVGPEEPQVRVALVSALDDLLDVLDAALARHRA